MKFNNLPDSHRYRQVATLIVDYFKIIKTNERPALLDVIS